MWVRRLYRAGSGYFTGMRGACGRGMRELQEYVSFLARPLLRLSMSPQENPVTPEQVEERLAREMSDVVRTG